MPEGEQGMNMARIGALLAGLPNSVGGVTVNRFCASGLTAMQMAADRIRVGEADVMIAGGAESMSMVPMTGNKPSFNPAVFAKDENVGIAYGMGLTAEKVASAVEGQPRGQDAFALQSHQKALAASRPASSPTRSARCRWSSARPTWPPASIHTQTRTVSLDEGPRADTTLEAWPSCAGVRRQGQRHRRQQQPDQRRRRRADPGQRKGGQAVRPEAAGALRQLCLARRAARDHGHRPDRGHPRRAEDAGLSLDDMGWIELNEAFAAQALAVIRTVGLNPAKVNPMGGAIALGHPLGATGAIRAATVVHALRRHS
jgi:acetyl-CoA acyltransferase